MGIHPEDTGRTAMGESICPFSATVVTKDFGYRNAVQCQIPESSAALSFGRSRRQFRDFQ
jgi:hypothetical protein